MLTQEKRDVLLEKIASLSDEQLERLDQQLDQLLEENDSTTEQRYLTFQCGGQTFGIHISHIRQILQLPQITPLPGFADYIKGVVSLRQDMIPTMDLNLRMGKPEPPHTSLTTLLVVSLGERPFGLIIDAVNNVEQIAEEDIQPLPKQGERDCAYLIGVAKKETAILILDVAELLGPEELASLSLASERQS